MENKKIVVCQYWTSNISYSKFTEAINRRYCDEKNYIYHIENDDEKIKYGIQDRAITWYKPKFISDVFDIYNPDYIFFLDADAIVCDYDYRIEDFIDESFDVICTHDYGPSRLNAGVFIMKNSLWTKEILNKWWEVCEVLEGGPNNQLGFYKHGLWHDQTCFGYLIDNESDSKSHIKIISNEILNGREFRDKNKKNFIFHAFSYGHTKNRTIDSAYYKMFDHKFELTKETKISEIAEMFPIDKNHEHDYYKRVYDQLFFQKNNVEKILEFSSHQFYNSFEILKTYFPNSEIIGVFSSISDEIVNDDRINAYICNQSEKNKLEEISTTVSNIDIIFDDGSHKMLDQQLSLYLFFKSLKPGGIYIIEDLHTSVECKMENKQVFGWGDINKMTTLETLKEFVKTGIFKSDYLSEDECNYLTKNIESCKIFDDRGDWSIVATLTKKIETSESIAVENYAKNQDGLIYQINKSPFVYDVEYVKNRYDSYGELSNYISYLRLGFILGCVEDTIESIIDIGYGNGAFLKTCQKTIKNCYGYDVTNYNLPEGVTHIEDWTKIKVDVVTFFDVIEHLENPYIIKDLDVKYVIISVPWCHYFSDDWFLKWKHRRPDEHLWFFNHETISNFAKSTNYEVIKYLSLEDVIRGKLDGKENILTVCLKKKLN